MYTPSPQLLLPPLLIPVPFLSCLPSATSMWSSTWVQAARYKWTLILTHMYTHISAVRVHCYRDVNEHNVCVFVSHTHTHLFSDADEGRVSILTLLNLSAAFDTLDHRILLARLHDMFGISGKAFGWFSSYLSDRFQSVSVNCRVSSQKKLRYGVPQGSVLGPVLFIQYTQPHCLISFPTAGAIITNSLTTLSFTNHRLHLTFIH